MSRTSRTGSFSSASRPPTSLGDVLSMRDSLALTSFGEAAPINAHIDSTIENVYPKAHEWDEDDIGHSMAGSTAPVARGAQRTLATFSLANKVCVVTGAARGLGNLFARTFVESGANQIVILDLDASQAALAASDLVEWFEKHGGAEKGEIEAVGYACDVSDEDAVIDCFERIVKKFGRVDVLVTAAGIVEHFAAEEYPSGRFRKLFAINVEGSFYCAREAAKDMMRREEAGSIIMVGSMSGSVVNIPQPQAPYNASKAAVLQLARSLAVEWATRNIRVNVLSPGYMLTALTRVILEREPVLKATWENLTPMGRLGEPEDLKGAIIYLASDASRFTTGVDMRVDGGYSLT